MQINELEKAVALQKKAYDLLLWLQERSRTNPHLFSTEGMEPFASGEDCAEWLQPRIDSFPTQFRPEPGEVRPFGFVLSSFFSVSFRVGTVHKQDEPEQTGLVPGVKAIRDRRHKRHTERRQQNAAAELRRLALTSLAQERGLELSNDMYEEALATAKTAEDLTLWTYACELVRRLQFASQGTAVHSLWLELTEKVRKNLTAATIWKARDRLELWLDTRSKRNGPR